MTDLAAEVRAADRDHYLATLFAPEDRRADLFALYAVNAELAAVPARVHEPLIGEMRLQWWRDAMSGAGDGPPVLAAFKEAVARRRLPPDVIATLIDSHAHDLYDDQPADEHALDARLMERHGTLMRLAAGILAGDSREHDAVRHAALACGLSHLVCGFAAMIRKGRLMLPQTLMQAHGLDRGALLAGQPLPSLRSALATLADRALEHEAKAWADLRHIKADARLALLPLALVAGDIEAWRRSADACAVTARPAQWRRIWWLWRGARRLERA